MKHAFSELYQAEDAGQLIMRTRCVRCGMGSTWAGSRDSCSGPVHEDPNRNAARRESSKERSARLRARARAATP